MRSLASLIGNLVASFPGVEHGQMHYRKLEKLKSWALKVNRGNFEAVVQLTGPAQAELRWWADNVTKGSKQISHGKPTVCLNTDASKAGWGAVRDGEKTGGRWTASEAEDGWMNGF